MLALLSSPASPLADFFSKELYIPELLIITGTQGVGKTSWFINLIAKARGLGIKVAGLVSPPVYVNGVKIGIDLLNIASGESRRLADLRTTETDQLRTCQWHFDPATLLWGNRILSSFNDCDLLILDELGPLEFKKGRGLQEGLALLDARRFSLSCVVIRPSLLPLAMERWPWGQVVQVTSRQEAEQA